MDESLATSSRYSSLMNRIACLLIVYLAIIQSLRASDTNVVYLMMDPIFHVGKDAQAIATAEQMKRETNSVESRPAELDPDGNWGTVVDGVQISIRLSTNVFTLGQPINATALVRNTTTNQVLLPAPQYLSIKFLVRDSKGNPLPPPEPEKVLQISGPPALGLPGHRQLRFADNLQRLYSLTTPGIYHVSAQDSLLVNPVTPGNQVSSAEATIEIVDKPY
jgi:hypothetical protein